MNASGSCQCRAVRFELRGEPLACYACHCQGCQRSAGGPYTLSLLARGEDLVVLSGEPSERAFDMPSGPRRWHGCDRCGSSLWYTAPVAPEFVAIKTGTLEDPGPYQPVAHLWTRHAQPHVRFAEGVARFEEQPSFAELIDLWAQRREG